MSPDKTTVGDEVKLIGTVLLCMVLFSFILPPSFMDKLSSFNAVMLFKVKHPLRKV